MSQKPLEPQLLMRRMRLDDLPADPLPAGYEMRLLRSEDDQALADLMQVVFPDYTWTVEVTRRALVNAPDVDAIYVIEHEGAVVATASARYDRDKFPDSGYVHWVGVHPDHRGRKLGRLISVRVLEHFRDAGCRDAVLETDDFRIPAIKTYLGLDFIPECDHPNHPERWARVEEILGRKLGHT
jgi:mycothiol synthase